MMQRSAIRCAADFKQKSRWSAVWPNMHYGAMYLNYSTGRQLPMKGVNWITRDSNRLTSFSQRYAAVLADIDEKRTMDELNIPIHDIRWIDHRRIFWQCSFCGSHYRKNVSVRVKFHAGCNMCKGKHASEVLREQQDVAEEADLAHRYPHLLAELLTEAKAAEDGGANAEVSPTDAAKSEKIKTNLGTLSPTSKFRALWRCSCCGGEYRAPIRCRTGVVEEGQCTLHPDITSWCSVCESCRWAKNMKTLATATMKDGSYLGLEMPPTKTAAVPRRKRFA